MKDIVKTSSFLKQFIIFLLLVLVVGNFSTGFYGMLQKGSTMPDDFIMRYRESKYILNHINTYDVVMNNVETLDSIGELWDVAGYSPWGMAMGIILNFAFLPESLARICYFFLFLLTIVSVAIVIYRSREIDKSFSLICALMALAIPGWGTGISFLNSGAVFGALLLFSVLLEKEHPIWAGIFLAVTSTKPQLALPFYLAFLLKKRYKIFLIGSIIPLCFWGVCAYFVSTNPVQLLFQFFQIGRKLTELVGGWLIPFGTYFDMNFSSLFFQFLGSISAIILAFIFWNNLKKTGNSNSFFYFSVPAVLSGMWTYSQEHDRTVLIIYLLCIFSILSKNDLVAPHKKIWITIFAISIIFNPTAMVRLQNHIIPSAQYLQSFYNLIRNLVWILGLFYISCVIPRNGDIIGTKFDNDEI